MSAVSDITPFRVAVPDADLQDLRERLARTRWPERETVTDWSQGIPLDYVREVCDYWAREYDWRRFEAQLNGYEQGLTNIDGVDIHFLHAPSAEPDARPLIITHGWPGSVAEYIDAIEPLRDPPAHGGERSDAYHVVVPSLPGYGFSGKPAEPGWGIPRIAAAWTELMRRLGYERFLAQGGDWGSLVTTHMGHSQTHAVEGIHINMAICSPQALLALGEPTERETRQLGNFTTYLEWENGYSQEQSTRPQTLGYGLTDSPAGQCAWILEKFKAWTDCDGHPENVIGRDKLLDNITLYWLTATAASSARLYWESYKAVLGDFTEVTAPAAYACFPHDLFTFTERWARTRYTDLRYYSEPERGGHFAALEQPERFVAEVRAGLRAVRSDAA
ncbi:MAG TPA: epoxide hydrolase [Solirubrobacteraceae bacterium]|nr:epoxide hydrolase [Solirubrobacteraceae bacterium]